MGWNGFILRALLLLAWVCADTVGAVEGPFQTKVQPFLRTYCVECHNADKAKADFRLDDIEGAITAGRDTERWEKALEMLSIGDMPPEKAERQPAKAQRQQVAAWIKTELKKIGRGPDDARLNRPEFGNRVDHEALFSGEHKGPAWSPSRLWRKSPQIHRRFENLLRLQEGNSPFAPKGGHGFQDYGLLLANESTITALRINAANYVAALARGPLEFPRGKDGKVDRSRREHSGKPRWREFDELVHAEGIPSEALRTEAVRRAFQLMLYREPTEAEVQRHAHGFLKQAIEIGGATAGLETFLTALILSPEFVYRQEMGLGPQQPDGRRMLAPREIAFALAYALTDSPPDEPLLKAVREGRLSTKTDVEREARRLLEADTRPYWSYEINHTFEKHVDACPNPRVLRFFRQFFGYDHVFDVFKDKGRNANHKPKFLFKDADLFVLSVLEQDRQVLKELLTSNRMVVHYADEKRAKRKLEDIRKNPNKNSAQLAKLAKGLTPVLGGYRGGEYYSAYNFARETWDYPVEQPFPVPHRAGMLTHPAWLVAHSGNFDTDPIRRGKWIREHLLADTIPEIPIGVDAALRDDPHKTLRERLDKTTAETCWRCHKKMNPLGLPFEAFDDFGRYRAEFYFDQDDKIAGTHFERLERIKRSQQRKQPAVEFTTRPINTTGHLTGTGDPDLDGPVKDAHDLVHRLARSERVRQSFVRHAFRYWMGRNETLDDSPTLIAADRAYVQHNGSFKELLVSLLTSDSFLMRKDSPEPKQN